MIVDSHCHVIPNSSFTRCKATHASFEKYLHRANKAGITRTVLFTAFHSDYTVANREVARIVTSNPNRFYGFAFIHAKRDGGSIKQMIKEAVERYGFCGIKVHRRDAPISREICEVARVYSLPVIYDIMGEVSVVQLVAKEYPDVSFIIPHLGSFADDWRVQLAMIDHLVRFPNIYADTSAARHFDLILQAVRRAGANKILFGTDGPWLHPGVELAKIYAMNLPPSQQRLILAENLLRLIGNVNSEEITNI